MEPALIEEIETVKKTVGKTLLRDEDILMLTAGEISGTTTFNEIHNRNAADASK